MTRDEILREVVRVMTETFELPAARVVEEARLVEDLDLDSIDAIDMAVKMQELTGARVDEQSLRDVRTVRDVVDLVERLERRK